MVRGVNDRGVAVRPSLAGARAPASVPVARSSRRPAQAPDTTLVRCRTDATPLTDGTSEAGMPPTLGSVSSAISAISDSPRATAIALNFCSKASGHPRSNPGRAREQPVNAHARARLLLVKSRLCRRPSRVRARARSVRIRPDFYAFVTLGVLGPAVDRLPNGWRGRRRPRDGAGRSLLGTKKREAAEERRPLRRVGCYTPAPLGRMILGQPGPEEPATA
jgi:hypothetical protein